MSHVRKLLKPAQGPGVGPVCIIGGLVAGDLRAEQHFDAVRPAKSVWLKGAEALNPKP